MFTVLIADVTVLDAAAWAACRMRLGISAQIRLRSDQVVVRPSIQLALPMFVGPDDQLFAD